MRPFIVYKNKFSPVIAVAIIAIIISFITRIALCILSGKNVEYKFLPGSFAIGFLYDVIVAGFIVIPFVLHVLFTNNFIYSKGKWLAIAGFVLVIGLFLFTDLVPRDFNKYLFDWVLRYIIIRFLIYVFLLRSSFAFRLKWRSFILKIFFSITVFILLFNAISECFFWDEFSSRYNFIAVDYLVYTNEVLGNIKESYPVSWLLLIAALCALAILLLVQRFISRSPVTPLSFAKRFVIAALFLLAPMISMYVIDPGWKNYSRNNYANELAGNGLYDFIQAFENNELDFYTFYRTIPDSEAFKIVRNQLATYNTIYSNSNGPSIERLVKDMQPENKMNVVLISVESLSASFMGSFGNKNNLTPFLDSLATQGILFTNLYASGTRTVRGLEALDLSIPPIPGQSLVKRKHNEDLFSLGRVFNSQGYISQFIYGGYGYFDNMNYFFAHNGYEVIDRTAIADPIHYANIWGVADEDLFTLALKTMDKNMERSKPFFTHIMTVSNHRPYTYPKNRIDIPPSAQSREGAVKYSDYAIGNFIQQAATRPWYSNTLFVIVADHCASSAGSTALPVTGYHIPLIIFAPSFIKPRVENALTSQVDIAPTILGLLHFSYRSEFFGQDIFNTAKDKRRAFISTYQGLGYIKNNQLIVQSPVKKIRSYLPDFITGNNKEVPCEDSLTREAIAFYQVAAWLIKNKKYK